MKEAVTTKEERQRLSAPSPGRAVWSSLAEWTHPILSTYNLMINNIDEHQREKIALAYYNAFSPLMNTWENLKLDMSQTTRLAASAILSIWMVSQQALADEAPDSFQEAEEWFLGRSFPPNMPRMTRICENWPPECALDIMSKLRFDDDFYDLFPYIVEVFETFTLHQHRKPSILKRNFGLYYTPSDVAEYIVREVLVHWKSGEDNPKPNTNLSCLDPACGSGVFLRAVLNWYLNENFHEGEHSRIDALPLIYGLELSPHAIQSCAFTILLDCIGDVLTRELSPWHVWQAIRGNLAVVDSTLVTGCGVTGDATGRYEYRIKTRNMLLNPNPQAIPASTKLHEATAQQPRTHPTLIGDIFPEMSEGFSTIIGNPPYSTTNVDKNQTTLSGAIVDQMNSARSTTGIAYLPFVKMMWNLANKRYARAGMVLPLSIAYHSGRRFREMRKSIMMAGERWRFAFFDRTPDSLFGDDIKTRNCIVFAEFHGANHTSIETTNLIRWNIEKRSELFSRVKFTELGNDTIEGFIPKIGSRLELSVYQLLRSKKEKLGSLWRPFRTRIHLQRPFRVYYRSTAYNWLPLFRVLPQPVKYDKPYNKSFHRLDFGYPQDANFAFAVASSRIAYWLWRVEGDGFHLNEGFLAGLPFHPCAFPESSLRELCLLSDTLWSELQKYPIQKINKRVLAVSYNYYRCTKVVEKIDKLIIEAYGIPSEFLDTLRWFMRETINAGRSNITRLSEAWELTDTEAD